MGWRDGSQRMRFEKRQEKQAEEYRKLGMTEEQIQTMYEFDMEQYRIERREVMHTQPILPLDFDEDEDDEEKLSLYCKYLEQFSTTIEVDVDEDNWNWKDDISNPAVLKAIKKLKPKEQAVLRIWAKGELTQEEIAAMFQIDQSTVSRVIKKFKTNFLKLA